jgi:group I intron endonuclease
MKQNLTPRKPRGQQGRCLIYGLIDPFTDELRYIGMSSCGIYRPRQHLKLGSRAKKTYLYNWINSVMDKGGTPIITVLTECSKEELAKKEIEFIAKYKSEGAKLTNLTTGGEGNPGRVVSKETSDKIRKALTGKKLTEEHKKSLRVPHKGNSAHRKGIKLSQEEKERISKHQEFKIKSLICNETNKVFRTTREAAKEMNLDRSNLMKHLKGKKNYKTIKGYTFKYLENING